MSKKISNLIQEDILIDSKSFKELTPVMKEAVKDVFKIIDKESSDIITRFEGAVEKVSKFHNINKEQIYKYFEKETNEQLGV
jgi:hypothetical protein